MKKSYVVAAVIALAVVIGGVGFAFGRMANPQNKTDSAASVIGQQEAETIALQDAGVNRETATAVTSTKDIENGQALWDVDIYADGWEYEYEIDGATGRILSRESEQNRVNTLPNAESTAPQTPLTAEQALDTALTLAGLTKEQISNLVIHPDSLKNEWEVEFTADGTKYEYTLNSLTGAVTESVNEPLDIPPAGSITEAQAKQTALDTATLTETQVTGLKAEYDLKDHRWEVEFVFDGMEYDYEIAASNGAVLKAEKELAA